MPCDGPPAEVRLLEISLQASRGAYQLEITCRLTAPWSVVFGPSGAGKSTLLRLIAGLDANSMKNGRIVLDGRELTNIETGMKLRPGARGVALVTQQPALFPHLSVEANVA